MILNSHTKANFFQMCVHVDDERYEGTGPTKQKAKYHAAKAALQKAFHANFSEETGVLDISNKNHIMALHEKLDDKDANSSAAKLMRQPLEVMGRLKDMRQRETVSDQRIEQPGAQKEASGVKNFTMCMHVDDERYDGTGPTKQKAKYHAAKAALQKAFHANKVAMKEWKRYSNMPAAKHLFSSTTLCIYRQPPNLKQMLVKTRISTTPTFTGDKKCMKYRCQICNIIDTRPSLKIPGINITVRPSNYYCNSSNVIYLIKCKNCHSGNYIGETSTFFRLRMNNHT